MEKKSIGRFIAVLRKASGLTQRELAERLNVSDKAVSRWERDESLPDLTLIPVLAEIFQVSSDELLRGERAAEPPSARDGRGSEKAERQKANLLRSVTASFQRKCLVSGGLALAGLLAAMVFNIGLRRAWLGFFTACLFYLASGVCQGVFLSQALSALGGGWEEDAVWRCRRRIAAWAAGELVLLGTLLGATVPLLFAGAAPYGLSGLSWLLWGLGFGSLGLCLTLILSRVWQDCRARRGLFGPEEGESAAGRQRRRRHCLLGTLAAVTLTLPVHMLLANEGLWTGSTAFENYEDFVAFMSVRDEADEAEEGADYSLRTIVNSAGEVVCRYRPYNRRVVSVRYPSSASCLPITVVTEADRQQGQVTADRLRLALCFLYPLELTAGVLLSMRKRPGGPSQDL